MILYNAIIYYSTLHCACSHFDTYSYLMTFPGGTEEKQEYLSQSIGAPGSDLNLGPPEYKVRAMHLNASYGHQLLKLNS
jgi:hypothetical protein